jgi:predicted transglutaminase-like cysteine proteinase
MLGKTKAAIVVGFIICWAGAAGAGEEILRSFKQAGGRAYAPIYGQAQPPIGFVDFCAREMTECRPLTSRARKIRLTPQRWRQLQEVNSAVNRAIAPASDIELYGIAEHWVVPSDAGDCEDYVLLKKRQLQRLGFAAETLLITVVLDEQGDGHAVLLARTESGDLVLDNRRDEIKRWTETRYQFLKRQSEQNPRKWLALTPKIAPDSGAIAGN